MTLIFLLFPMLLKAQAFPQTLSCVSVINSNIYHQEVPLNEFAMAQIHFSKEDWSYTADVIENRLNSITIENLSSKSKVSVHSTDISVKHLHVRHDVWNIYATVDCELKF